MDKNQAAKINQAQNLIEQAKDLVSGVQDDLQSEYDDKPEGWQESDKGEEAKGVIDTLEEQAGALEGVKDALDTTLV